MEDAKRSSLFSKPWLTTALVVALFVAALGIRLYDLTDLPNDFYMVRQYRSLLISRGMYYEHLTTVPEWQRNLAVAQWKGEGLIEPPIMEALTALTYDFTGVQIWIGRIYASLFWLSGGLAIWLLAREMSMRGGGIIALAYYLFVPFGVTVSRAFLPDSLMVALIAWSLWALYRWEIRRTWKSAILAGILMGITIFVKSVAVFPLLGAAIGLVLSRGSLKRILADKQTWAVVGITAIPTIIYYIYGFTSNDLGSQFSLRFFPEMLKDPSFYVRWLFLASRVLRVCRHVRLADRYPALPFQWPAFHGNRNVDRLYCLWPGIPLSLHDPRLLPPAADRDRHLWPDPRGRPARTPGNAKNRPAVAGCIYRPAAIRRLHADVVSAQFHGECKL